VAGGVLGEVGVLLLGVVGVVGVVDVALGPIVVVIGIVTGYPWYSPRSRG
tara:strand:- start:94 stop:243 length:150 start_codon:yes stop_codon:yes gene_type:complete